MSVRRRALDALGVLLGGLMALAVGSARGGEPNRVSDMLRYMFYPSGPVGEMSIYISNQVRFSMGGVGCLGDPACWEPGRPRAVLVRRDVTLVVVRRPDDWSWFPAVYPPVVQQLPLVESLREGSRHRRVEAIAPALFSGEFAGDPWLVNLRSLADVYTGADQRSPVARAFAVPTPGPAWRDLPGDAERLATMTWVSAQLASPEYGPPPLLPPGTEEEVTRLRLRGDVLGGLRLRQDVQDQVSRAQLLLLVLGPDFEADALLWPHEAVPDELQGWVGEGWTQARPALPPEGEWCGEVATEVLFLRALQLSLNDSADAAVRYLDEHPRRGCGPTPWSENLRGLGRVLRSKAATRFHLSRTSSPPPPRSL